MFKGLGTWLGLERAEDPPRGGRPEDPPEERIVQQQNEVNKQRTEEDPTGTQKDTSPTGTQEETSPTGTQEDTSPTRTQETQRDQGLSGQNPSPAFTAAELSCQRVYPRSRSCCSYDGY